jgi:pimeloyl-ACP methyl ester carboxylesterase
MTVRATFAALALAIALLFAPPARAYLDTTQAVATAPALAAAPDQLFTAGNVTLRYREIGSGEPVVLLHGYGAALEAWNGIAGTLATDHRVIAVDLRGFGKSTKLADAKGYGIAMADDIVRLIDHLKLQRVHLGGHSMGALIAANIAARHKSRVITASLIAGPFYEKAAFAKEVAPWIADLEAGRGLGNFLQWLFPGMDAKTAEFASAQLAKANDAAALVAVLRSLPDLVVSGKAALEVPSLITVGTADPLLQTSRDLAGMGKARVVELPDVNHVAILGVPEVVQAMRELMQGNGRTKGQENNHAVRSFASPHTAI